LPGTSTPYAQEMIMIHRVFRREAAPLRQYVGAVRNGDVTRAHLTPGEWARVGRNGLAGLPRNRILLALGAILEDAGPAERAEFMRKVPLPGRIAWKPIGQRQYRNWRASVRGAEAVTAAGRIAGGTA
jgi:hypothetical protein